ncbi:MAG: hypothetical protein AUG46_11525 [Acidobacteria bacterium 13_1_20CM_3_58_11]|nr:MAG: hypothetical protein AUG46_11525 [Acidobacteria bacterium 13_1_20CM_3_58_11]
MNGVSAPGAAAIARVVSVLEAPFALIFGLDGCVVGAQAFRAKGHLGGPRGGANGIAEEAWVVSRSTFQTRVLVT